jgi:putative ABC transport system permease protein
MPSNGLVRLLRRHVWRSREDRALDDEMQLHLDLLEAQARDRGVPAEQAGAEARRRFGHPTTHREAARDRVGLTWIDDLRQDVRYGARVLVRERRFAFTALLTLALGTGATTAIFSVVSGLVLRPLPFPEPARLVQIYGRSALGDRDPVSNLPAYRDAGAFEAMAGYEVGARYWRHDSAVERVMAVRTEPSFFGVLRTSALLGRSYGPADPVSLVVVSERFWRTRLGGQASVLGSPLALDGETFTIVGVMPESFQFPYGAASLLPGVAAQTRTDLWMPFPSPIRGRVSQVVARLGGGATAGSAQGAVDAVSHRLQAADPARNGGRSARVVPLAQAVVAPEIRRLLFLLFGAVGVVLALACANVINLFLGRMADRSREIAVRAALGARWFRLVRQLLAESLLLSLLGGVLGLALAWVATSQFVALAGPLLPRAADVALDWRVFAFLFGICTLSGVVTGLAPALIAARRDGRAALQESAVQTTPGPAQRWLRDVLVVFEIAAALVMAIAAATLGRELVRLRNADGGMQARNAVTVHVGHRLVPTRGEERPLDTNVRPFLDIESRVARLPGVEAAGFTQLLPLQNWGWTSNSRDFRVRGETPPPAIDFPIQLRYVTPGYFRAQGVPVVAGRTFTASDDRHAPFAIVINETLARRTFGTRNPIGAETTRGTVVGVVADVRQVHLDRPTEPEIYYTIVQNWSQLSELGMTLVVRTGDRPEASIDAVRAIIREVGPHLAVFNVKTMDRVVADSIADFTLYLSLIGGFAILALVLAVSGTYGVVSYVAMTRVREVAIRMALGADRRTVVRMMLRRGGALAGAGLVIGSAAAVLASPLLGYFPVAVRPPDALTIVPVAAVLGLIAVLASAVPARRAARTDPMTALRND